jgi:hypothetical protein
LGIGAISKIKAESYHQPLFEFEVHQRLFTPYFENAKVYTNAMIAYVNATKPTHFCMHGSVTIAPLECIDAA